MITHSLGNNITKEDLEKVNKQADEFFLEQKDKEQITSKNITFELVTRKFPNSLNIIKDDKKIIGHTFLLPCDEENRIKFLSEKISEVELFYKIKDEIKQENYDSLYLVSAQILEEYRRKGITTDAFIMQIKKYQTTIPNLKLFSWAITKNGEKLAKRISKIIKLEIKNRI